MQGGDTMAMINAIWPFILMGGIFYFMLYRPQKQEQQKRQRMLDSLKKGDKVVTVGGMFGVITAISEKKVTLKLAEDVEVDFARFLLSVLFKIPSNRKWQKNNEETTIAQGVKIFAQSAF